MAGQFGLIVHRVVLATEVLMMNESLGRRPHDGGLAQRGQSQIALQAVADGLADHAVGEQVDGHSQIELSLPCPDIRDAHARLMVGVPSP